MIESQTQPSKHKAVIDLTAQKLEVNKFGRIDILINNASALWWQRTNPVQAICGYSAFAKDA